MKFHDFMRLAKYVVENDLDIAKEIPDPNVIMRRSSIRPNNREFTELLKRYKLLTPAQRQLIVDLDPVEQRQLVLVALCKAHPIVRDFIIEVVREKFLGLDFQLTEADYQSFFNRKMELHSELEQYSESTGKKAKQVIWRILEQAGLIDNTKDRTILPQFVNQRIVNAVRDDNPELLKIFLMTDRDIKELHYDG